MPIGSTRPGYWSDLGPRRVSSSGRRRFRPVRSRPASTLDLPGSLRGPVCSLLLREPLRWLHDAAETEAEGAGAEDQGGEGWEGGDSESEGICSTLMAQRDHHAYLGETR